MAVCYLERRIIVQYFVFTLQLGYFLIKMLKEMYSNHGYFLTLCPTKNTTNMPITYYKNLMCSLSSVFA